MLEACQPKKLLNLYKKFLIFCLISRKDLYEIIFFIIIINVFHLMGFFISLDLFFSEK